MNLLSGYSTFYLILVTILSICFLEQAQSWKPGGYGVRSAGHSRMSSPASRDRYKWRYSVAEIVRSVPAMLARSNPILARLNGLRRPVMVEIGTSGGLMAEHLLASRDDLILHCVDSWADRSAQPVAYIATGDIHARLTQADQDFLAATAMGRLRRFGARAVVHRMTSLMAAEQLMDGVADLIFDDSDHSYLGVRSSVRAWWRVLRSGGYFGWHDYDNASNPAYDFSGVRRAVDEFAAEHGLSVGLDTGYTAFVVKP
jgi:hypothetical protein